LRGGSRDEMLVRYLSDLITLFLALFITLGVLEPLQEGLSSLVNLLAGRDVDVLLAGLGAPCLEGFLRDKVVLEVAEEDSGDLAQQSGTILANKTLCTAKEGLLVALRSDHLLEERSTILDLLNDLVIEDALGQDSNSLVLGLNAEFASLLVDLDVADLCHITGLRGGVDNPATQLLVSGGAVSLVIIAILENKRALQVIGQVLGTSLDGLLGHVDCPIVVSSLINLDFLGLRVDTTSQLIVTTSLDTNVTILVTVLGTIAVARAGFLVTVGGLLLLCFTASLLVLLVFLATLGVVTHNEGAQLKTRVDVRALTTGLAVESDLLILDVDIGLRVLALLAKNELGDEAIQVILELRSIVSAVDDPTFVGGLGVGLSTQFKTEVFDEVGRRTAQRSSDGVKVDNDGLNTVTLTLDLGLELLHLVTIEGIGDIPANINGGHIDGLEID